MQNDLKLLILEETPGDLQTIVQKQSHITCRSARVESQASLLRQFETFCPDVVLLRMTSLSGNESLLDVMREKKPQVPFLVVSDRGSEEQGIDAVRRGALDYIPGPNLSRLPTALAQAFFESQNRRRAARLSRVQAVRSAVASAIVRISDRQKVFEAACRIAVQHGSFKMAWVGVMTPEAAALRPVAWSGHDDGYLERVTRLAVRVNEEDCRGKGDVLKRFGSIVVNDISQDKQFILKEDALARGYCSMIALPLIVSHRVVAVLKIYADEPNFFSPEERAVLANMASDLSIALDHRAKEERLCRLAYHDALTGLANRRLLYEHMKRELARAYRHQTMVAVVFIDLDNFKAVNDTLGHSAGDRLLQEVSSRIVSCTREGDIAARLGGDEFVMVLPIQCDRDSLLTMVNRVVENVSRPFRIGNKKLNVNCSIGIAVYPQDGRDCATLLRHADATMYQAKCAGNEGVRRGNLVSLRSATGAR